MLGDSDAAAAAATTTKMVKAFLRRVGSVPARTAKEKRTKENNTSSNAEGPRQQRWSRVLLSKRLAFRRQDGSLACFFLRERLRRRLGYFGRGDLESALRRVVRSALCPEDADLFLLHEPVTQETFDSFWTLELLAALRQRLLEEIRSVREAKARIWCEISLDKFPTGRRRSQQGTNTAAAAAAIYEEAEPNEEGEAEDDSDEEPDAEGEEEDTEDEEEGEEDS